MAAPCRDPGPALPDRAGAVPHATVRHRARRAAARLSAGGPGLAGRVAAGPADGQGALGGRLVDAATARTVARVRRARRRGAHRAARRARGRARGDRQGRLGRRGVRVAQGLHPADPRGPVAAYVGPAQGPRPSGPRRRARSVDHPRPDRRRARRHAEPDHPRLGDRGRGPGDADHPDRPQGDQGLLRPRSRPLRRALGRGADTGTRPPRGTAADPNPARRRAAATAGLGRQGPGRRQATAARA